MMPIDFSAESGKPLTLLCVGAHSDDIEIGAGATILEMARKDSGASIHWVVFSAADMREAEARASADRYANSFADATIELFQFRDGLFPAELERIKARFEEIKSRCCPDVVFTHFREDRHQDHKAVSDLTWQTFRNHMILEYEIPKYDGDLGSPNFFFPISERCAEEKLTLLEEYFGSQRGRSWFSRETFRALLRLRGIECNSPTGLAEGFYCRKAVLRADYR